MNKLNYFRFNNKLVEEKKLTTIIVSTLMLVSSSKRIYITQYNSLL